MKKTLSNISVALLGCSAIAGLAACGEETETTTVADTQLVDPNPAPNMVLTPEQQARRDAMDMAAYQTEYQGYEEQDAAISVAANTDPASADKMMNEDARVKAGMSKDDMNKMMKDPSSMSFAYLDRNSDNRLSVGEYAIYAVHANPARVDSPDDQVRPSITADEANEAADSFFYYDQDGDTYLSESEFMMAKNANVASS